MSKRRNSFHKLLRVLRARSSRKAEDINFKLLAAARKRNLNGVKEAISREADIAFLDDFGCSALHLAAEAGGAECAEFLVQAGADMGAVDRFECTALHLAARSGNHDCVSMLCDLGADVHVRDVFRRTPLELAIRARSIESIKCLIERGAQFGRHNLYESVFIGCHEIIPVLCDAGVDPNEKDPFGRPAIALASELRDKKTVVALIQAGAKTEDIEIDGVEFLAYAKNMGWKDVVSLVGKKGMDSDGEDFSV